MSRPSRIFISTPGQVVTSQTQLAFRFRNDDGSESTATWAAAENINITAASLDTRRVRALINATGDPDLSQYQIEYKLLTDPDSAYKKIN